jgi:hypothetical protein
MHLCRVKFASGNAHIADTRGTSASIRHAASSCMLAACRKGVKTGCLRERPRMVSTDVQEIGPFLRSDLRLLMRTHPFCIRFHAVGRGGVCSNRQCGVPSIRASRYVAGARFAAAGAWCGHRGSRPQLATANVAGVTEASLIVRWLRARVICGRATGSPASQIADPEPAPHLSRWNPWFG